MIFLLKSSPVVPTANPKRLTATANRLILAPDERSLYGSIRRECVDHVIALGEAHLRGILQSYARYYNDPRTHCSLDKDAPFSRPVQRTGSITSQALLGGLHHHYMRGTASPLHASLSFRYTHAESVPIDASGLYKIAHSVEGNGSGKGNPAAAKFKSGHKKWNLFILVPIVSLYGEGGTLT
jgi:hypothetical protein